MCFSRKGREPSIRTKRFMQTKQNTFIKRPHAQKQITARLDVSLSPVQIKALFYKKIKSQLPGVVVQICQLWSEEGPKS